LTGPGAAEWNSERRELCIKNLHKGFLHGVGIGLWNLARPAQPLASENALASVLVPAWMLAAFFAVIMLA
jgi:hypothetical protein